jgi:hypothetical protein
MHDFMSGAIGGVVIGLAAASMLMLNGRVAGISGIISGAVGLDDGSGARSWRLLFLAGLLVGGAAFVVFDPRALASGLDRSPLALAVAGLLVGFGTRLGGGCTSGHGVCGLGQLSGRSLVATLTFMATGAVTVFVVNHLLGGVL